MRCQDDINTEHNMKSIGRAAVAQWTTRLTRNGQTRVQIREAHIFNITHSTGNSHIKFCTNLEYYNFTMKPYITYITNKVTRQIIVTKRSFLIGSCDKKANSKQHVMHYERRHYGGSMYSYCIYYCKCESMPHDLIAVIFLFRLFVMDPTNKHMIHNYTNCKRLVTV